MCIFFKDHEIHNLSLTRTGTVMLMESSSVGTAKMASMRLTTNSTIQCLRFSYYMNLNQDNDVAEIS